MSCCPVDVAGRGMSVMRASHARATVDEVRFVLHMISPLTPSPRERVWSRGRGISVQGL